MISISQVKEGGKPSSKFQVLPRPGNGRNTSSNMSRMITSQVKQGKETGGNTSSSLLRSESSVAGFSHSFHIPRKFLRFSTRMALFFSLTSHKTQTVGEDTL
jgi:hypothetical protein